MSVPNIIIKVMHSELRGDFESHTMAYLIQNI